ncbi:hypothetical protein [Streptomyces sp. NBC_01294]|uniref:hypothetical protein n=1 Tax=Streptomyces sp. NBC_01294 TaxID=2903815 RepID=UPI002DDC5861|nr:hypothetical protein [Streptomyces sp. NBC_01294]
MAQRVGAREESVSAVVLEAGRRAGGIDLCGDLGAVVDQELRGATETPTPSLSPRPDRKAGRNREQATDVATVEQTRRTLEAAARMTAKLQGGIRKRAAARRTQPQPATATPRTQQPAALAPGRTTSTGGVA